MTTILEHIQRGHYPTDRQGRPLVLAESGWTATIVATDGARPFRIIGFGRNSTVSWDRHGRPWEVGGAGARDRLLPPKLHLV